MCRPQAANPSTSGLMTWPTTSAYPTRCCHASALPSLGLAAACMTSASAWQHSRCLQTSASLAPPPHAGTLRARTRKDDTAAPSVPSHPCHVCTCLVGHTDLARAMTPLTWGSSLRPGLVPCGQPCVSSMPVRRASTRRLPTQLQQRAAALAAAPARKQAATRHTRSRAAGKTWNAGTETGTRQNSHRQRGQA